MTRKPFKCRIWDREERRWLENGASLHCFSNWQICPFTGEVSDFVGCFGGSENQFTRSTYQQDVYFDKTGGKFKRIDAQRFEIQEAIGLNDRHGREIYCGDTISFGYTGERVFHGTVQWFNDRAAYGITFGNAFETFDGLIGCQKHLEVTGNIFGEPHPLQD